MRRMKDGNRSYSARYFRSLAMEWDRDHVVCGWSRRIRGGVRIVLMEINTYDIAVADVKKLKEDAE